MTFFVYDTSDNKKKSSGFMDINSVDPKPILSMHYYNLRMIRFFFDNAVSGLDKIQLEKELEFCKKKMAFWENHPSVTPTIIQIIKAEVDRKWSTERR